MVRRRDLLAGFGALAASARGAATSLVRPPALRPGDTVGLITPATYVSDPDLLALVERTIKYFGLKMKLGRYVGRRHGYLAGTDEERLEDLHGMFRDPEIKAVFAIRGGYGSARLLDRIDYGLIRSNPKIFLGYSDITALHLAIHKHAGLVTFHGPIVLSEFTEYTQTWFRRALFEAKPLGRLTNPPEKNPLRPEHPLRTVRPGRASGRLIGGNLSLICSTLGTPFEIDTRGRILFIEDVDEQPYSVDRMLTQLRLAGKLQAAAGIIFGECRSCRPRDYRPSFESTLSVGEVIDEILGKFDIPVLSGLTIGHTGDQLTLPLGVPATLDADRGELVIEEAAVT
ncbi:MAG TPA: LD-carboxypeptidase [Bryobacteraceae bacterium]|nr:LD-carboxypeptidase [Bryobacteraceae bacterium]HOQ47205.1 LD-carboxypeptidase [Bryobacteraceae bacterium]HPQ16776.1 LD-carboxypeptidase [Bryobacteraceae bacterium]HPU74083.1 LD-carboxypeptidase [Bryobacteraceae bacterium]